MIIYSGDANRPYVVPTPPQTDPEGPKLVLVIAPQDTPAREGTEMVLTSGSRVKPMIQHGHFVPVAATGVRRQDDFESINHKEDLVKPTNQPEINVPEEYTIAQPQQQDNENHRIDQQAISETLTAPYPYEVTTPGYNLVYQYENDDITNDNNNDFSKVKDDFKPSDADILSNSIPDNNIQNNVLKTYKVEDIQLTERMDTPYDYGFQTKVRPYPPPRPTIPPPPFTKEQVFFFLLQVNISKYFKNQMIY